MAENPDLKYYFHNETLRAEFYNHSWDLNLCEKHSIFLSQSSYEIKGIHFLIKALPFILRKFPDTRVYVGGKNIKLKSSIFDWLRYNRYSRYIEELLKTQKVDNHFIFLGPLSEQEIVQQYLKAHLFICPSTIENSPNSLAEAQLLGVPCIASYVGGIPDMVVDGETGLLYRCEEYEMLADAICRVFEDDNLAAHLSSHARIVAKARHDRRANASRLQEIYNLICGF